MRLNSAGDLAVWLESKIKAIEDVADEVLPDLMEEGATLMQEYIAVRGRPTSNPGPGRIDTGFMIDHVTHEVNKERDHVTDGFFGWKPEDFEAERTPFYPVLQEEGFVHAPDGQFIEGMHALQDASDWARNEFLRRVNENLHDA